MRLIECVKLAVDEEVIDIDVDGVDDSVVVAVTVRDSLDDELEDSVCVLEIDTVGDSDWLADTDGDPVTE